MKKPVTVYTRASFADPQDTKAAEGFDSNGVALGRAAYLYHKDCIAVLASGRGCDRHVFRDATHADAIRWVALGVLPDEEG
jgi:hypothetical protein